MEVKDRNIIKGEMNKWNEGDDAINALREWKFSGLKTMEKRYAHNREKLRQKCSEIVHNIVGIWWHMWFNILTNPHYSSKTLNRDEFIRQVDSSLPSITRWGTTIQLPLDHAPIDYLNDRIETHVVLNEILSECREIFYRTMLVGVVWNDLSKETICRIVRIWVNVCRGLMLMPKSYMRIDQTSTLS